MSVLNSKLVLRKSRVSKFKKLDLSKCDINLIEEDSFYGIADFISIDLSCNKINTIQFKIFEYLDLTLTEVNLSNNEIRTLNSEMFTGLSNLTKLNLSFREFYLIISIACKYICIITWRN